MYSKNILFITNISVFPAKPLFDPQLFCLFPFLFPLLRAIKHYVKKTTSILCSFPRERHDNTVYISWDRRPVWQEATQKSMNLVRLLLHARDLWFISYLLKAIFYIYQFIGHFFISFHKRIFAKYRFEIKRCHRCLAIVIVLNLPVTLVPTALF